MRAVSLPCASRLEEADLPQQHAGNRQLDRDHPLEELDGHLHDQLSVDELKERSSGARGGRMVKISDKTDYSRFVRPTDEDEGIWLDHVEAHLVTHPVGQVKEMHVHDPPQDHVVVIRSGRMRWTVEDQTLDAGPGDVIVTPAGVAHAYEVLGDKDARVVCVDSPTRPKPE
jgi:quercetin dioxygenase-like cupin family protein